MTFHINPEALGVLAGGFDGPDGVGRAIREQEAAGASRVVHSDRLPKQHGPREPWEALGFVFGDDVDDLYVSVTLPDGWKKAPGADPRGPVILDQNGRKRVSMFVKEAFYDRKANAYLVAPRSYVQEALYAKHDELIVDDWTTVDVLVDALVEAVEEATADLGIYDGRDDDYGRRRLQEAKDELARIDRWTTQLEARRG